MKPQRNFDTGGFLLPASITASGGPDITIFSRRTTPGKCRCTSLSIPAVLDGPAGARLRHRTLLRPVAAAPGHCRRYTRVSWPIWFLVPVTKASQAGLREFETVAKPPRRLGHSLPCSQCPLALGRHRRGHCCTPAAKDLAAGTLDTLVEGKNRRRDSHRATEFRALCAGGQNDSRPVAFGKLSSTKSGQGCISLRNVPWYRTAIWYQVAFR